MAAPKILAFGGSLRARSSNNALARYAASRSSSIILAPTLSSLPFYDQDVEDVGVPAPVLALRSLAFGCSAFIFSTPEYNGFTSAALKNAIDWLSRSGAEGTSPLKGKPFAVMSAGGGMGGARAQKNIIAIANDFKMLHVGADSPIALNIFDKISRFDASSGDLTDNAVKERIAALVKQLEAAAAAHKSA
jgi:NAD(P)H-dependent FMN reductase